MISENESASSMDFHGNIQFIRSRVAQNAQKYLFKTSP
jgi:hypothetical protein